MKIHYAVGGVFVHRTGVRYTARPGWPVCGLDYRIGGALSRESVTCRACLAFLEQWGKP